MWELIPVACWKPTVTNILFRQVDFMNNYNVNSVTQDQIVNTSAQFMKWEFVIQKSSRTNPLCWLHQNNLLWTHIYIYWAPNNTLTIINLYGAFSVEIWKPLKINSTSRIQILLTMGKQKYWMGENLHRINRCWLQTACCLNSNASGEGGDFKKVKMARLASQPKAKADMLQNGRLQDHLSLYGPKWAS